MTQPLPEAHATIEIASLAELEKHEGEVLARIAACPNGGQLFLAHPFRLLRDLGVHLSSEVESEILRRHPEISGLSHSAYEAAKSAPPQRNVRFRVRGLFGNLRPEDAP